MYQINEATTDHVMATIVTNYGDIVVKLFPKEAPKAVENFTTHAKNGYYDGVIFHRVIENFMIQSGDPQGTGRGGESIWGSPFEDEFCDSLHNIRGALSMANAGPNTNGSQFFIVQMETVQPENMPYLDQMNYDDEVKKYYCENGGAFWLDGKHTVFGQVMHGMEIVDQIAKSPTDSWDCPLKDIVIEKIVI